MARFVSLVWVRAALLVKPIFVLASVQTVLAQPQDAATLTAQLYVAVSDVNVQARHVAWLGLVLGMSLVSEAPLQFVLIVVTALALVMDVNVRVQAVAVQARTAAVQVPLELMDVLKAPDRAYAWAQVVRAATAQAAL